MTLDASELLDLILVTSEEFRKLSTKSVSLTTAEVERRARRVSQDNGVLMTTDRRLLPNTHTHQINYTSQHRCGYDMI